MVKLQHADGSLNVSACEREFSHAIDYFQKNKKKIGENENIIYRGKRDGENVTGIEKDLIIIMKNCTGKPLDEQCESVLHKLAKTGLSLSNQIAEQDETYAHVYQEPINNVFKKYIETFK